MIHFEDHLLAPASAAALAEMPSLALAEVIGASLDVTETVRAIASALRAVTGADRSVIFLHDAARGTLRQVTSTADRFNWDENIILRGRDVGDLPLWFAVRDSANGVLELADTVRLRALTEPEAKRTGMGAVLGLALRHPSVTLPDDAPLGIAFCSWDEAQQAFDPVMVRAARSIAAQGAVAVANARNHAHGEELVLRLTTLASWASRLAASATPAQVASRAARAASVLLDAPLVAHWSPGRVAWYPSPPVVGEDHEAELAMIAAACDRSSVIDTDALSPLLRNVVRDRDLQVVITSAPADRSSMLLAARSSALTGIDTQIANLLIDLSASALRTAEAHAAVAHLALTDALTDVGNRRAFELRLGEALSLARRSSRPMTLCLIDLDNFRAFNERGGHQLGDMALRIVADALRGAMRGSDQVFRIGGDEFALVLQDTAAANAVSLLQRVLATLRTSGVEGLSITAGVAEAPAQGVDVTDLSRAADEALYAGKRDGRARVTVAAAR